MRLYLHPKKFDLDKPIRVTINGEVQEHMPTTSARMMLELVREFDDRGRVFYATIDLNIASSSEVPLPTYRE
jgi:hypothetical protein